MREQSNQQNKIIDQDLKKQEMQGELCFWIIIAKKLD